MLLARTKYVEDILRGIGATQTAATKWTLFGRLFKTYRRKNVFGTWNSKERFPVGIFMDPEVLRERFAARYGLNWDELSGNLVHENRWDLSELLSAPGDPLGLGIKYSSQLTLEEQMDLTYVYFNGGPVINTYFNDLAHKHGIGV